VPVPVFHAVKLSETWRLNHPYNRPALKQKGGEKGGGKGSGGAAGSKVQVTPQGALGIFHAAWVRLDESAAESGERGRGRKAGRGNVSWVTGNRQTAVTFRIQSKKY